MIDQPVPPNGVEAPGHTRRYVEVRDRNGKVLRKELSEQRALTAGSALQADFPLEGLARFQLRFSRQGDQVFVEHLGGLLSPRINAKDLVQKPVLWPDDTRLVIGPYQFRQSKDSGEAFVPSLVQPPPPKSGAVEPIEIVLTPEALNLKPGETARATVGLTNASADTLDGWLELELEDELARTLPPSQLPRRRSFALHPGASVSEEFTYTVPRAPEPNARAYDVTVRVEASPREAGAGFEAKHKASWQVLPFSEPPELQASGAQWRHIEGRRWKHRLRLRNPTNQSGYFRMSVVGQQGADPYLELSVSPSGVLLGPGKEELLTLECRTGALYSGNPAGELIQVLAQSNTGEESAPLLLTFRPRENAFAQVQELVRERSRDRHALLLLIGTALFLSTLIGLVVLTASISTSLANSSATQTAVVGRREAQANMIALNNAQASATKIVGAQIEAQQSAVAATIQAQATAVVSATVVAEQTADAFRTTQATLIVPIEQTAVAFSTDQASRQSEATVAAILAQREEELLRQADADLARRLAEVGGTATTVANQTATSDAQRTIVAESVTQQAIVRATEVAQAQPVRFTIGGVKLCVAVGESLGTVVITVYDVLGRQAAAMTDTARVELQPVDRSRGRLQGTLEDQLDNGIARFTDLSISAPGYYRLLGRYRRFEPQPSEIIQVVDTSQNPPEPCANRVGANPAQPGAAAIRSEPTAAPEPEEPALLPSPEVVTPVQPSTGP